MNWLPSRNAFKVLLKVFEMFERRLKDTHLPLTPIYEENQLKLIRENESFILFECSIFTSI